MLDPDAYPLAIKLALTLSEYKRVKVCKFPINKDVNDLGRKKSLLIYHKTPYLEYRELLALQNQYQYDKRFFLTH